METEVRKRRYESGPLNNSKKKINTYIPLRYR